MDADHIRQAADIIARPIGKGAPTNRIAQELADAGLLVTPEQRAVLDAAAIVVDEWVIRGDRMVAVATQIGLLAAVDALRRVVAETPPKLLQA